MLIAPLLWWLGERRPLVTTFAPAISLLFITLTTVVLVADLKRPERFYYILTRPNWRSWLVWGTWFLVAHGTISAAWLVSGLMGWTGVISTLCVPAMLVAVLATSYTGFLFAQGLGRDLWQGPHAAIDLVAQSGSAGAATLLIAALLSGSRSARVIGALAFFLLVSVLAHFIILVFENLLSPSPTRHHELAVQTIRRGAYARLFWGGAIAVGCVFPLLIWSGVTAVSEIWGVSPPSWVVVTAAIAALSGGAAWDYIWVEAGQSVPLS
jgi:formate-dependent nitrite reductase membrane component NrfD